MELCGNSVNAPKVSVIVPMYNVEGKLDKCIYSLCNQTMPDIELVFVNDCSSDNGVGELEILLKKYAKDGFSSKIVSHPENCGVAAARNTGVQNATGDYIYYVDADDYIELDAIETMYNMAVEADADIVVCEWLLTFSKKERHVKQPEVSTGRGMFELMTNGTMRWNLWLFMARRSLYMDNDVRFVPGMNMGEDMMVMLKLALCSDRTCVIHRPLYHYIQTNTSSLTKDYLRYKEQLTFNVEEIERFVSPFNDPVLNEQVLKLKLSTKLPLLISDNISDFELWQTWFPETRELAKIQYGVSWRTYMLQYSAAKKRYWLLKLYYRMIIRLVYGIIYK